MLFCACKPLHAVFATRYMWSCACHLLPIFFRPLPPVKALTKQEKDLTKVYQPLLFSRAFHLFLCEQVESRQILSISCFSAIATPYMFSSDCPLWLVSRACHPLYLFPRLPPVEAFPRWKCVTCFPAISTRYMFSRACHPLPVYPRLPPVLCAVTKASYINIQLVYCTIAAVIYAEKTLTHFYTPFLIAQHRILP